MTDEDLLPLKAGGDAPPELVHTLYALGQDGVDAARLERLARELAVSLASARPVEAAGPLRGRPGRKLLIAGVALGFVALGWFGYRATSCSRSMALETTTTTTTAAAQAEPLSR